MSIGAFSLDQLMELAGISVSQASEHFPFPQRSPIPEFIADKPVKVYRVHPPSKGRKVLIACGPGNNGTRE